MLFTYLTFTILGLGISKHRIRCFLTPLLRTTLNVLKGKRVFMLLKSSPVLSAHLCNHQDKINSLMILRSYFTNFLCSRRLDFVGSYITEFLVASELKIELIPWPAWIRVSEPCLSPTYCAFYWACSKFMVNQSL